MVIEIKPKTILMILIVISLFSIAMELKTVFVLLFFAFILYSAFLPIVNFLRSKDFSKTFSIITVFILTFIILVLLVTLVSIPLFEQFNVFYQNLPTIIERIIAWISGTFPQFGQQLNTDEVIKEIMSSTNTDSVVSIISNLGNIFSSSMQFLFNSFIVLVMSGFMLSLNIDQRDVLKILNKLGIKDTQRFQLIFFKIVTKVGMWFRSQLIICLTSAIVTTLLFTILGFEFAIPMGIIAGLFELIPNFGTALQIPLASVLALATGEEPILVIIYLVAVLIWQQIQGNFIVPKLMHKTVGLNPLVTLFAVLSGTALLGAAGAVLAIPIAAILQISFEEYFSR